MEIDVKFWPNKNGNTNGWLGNGFITSGLLKTRFRVFESNNSSTGIRIALHSEKKDDGTWDNDIVSFVNGEAHQKVCEMVKQKINGESGTSSGGGTVVNNPPVRQPSEINTGVPVRSTPF